MPLSADVLVIGGGATGAGVAWDCALRGFSVVMVDRTDLAMGTSGRFHGLLHSGGRYVVKDQSAAIECVEENAIVRRIAADTIEDTGGLFVTTPDDDPAYGDAFLAGCRETGVVTEEITPAEALKSEPLLNPGISRAFTVADANIDAWKLVWGLARGARAHGGTVLPYHEIVAVHREGDKVVGATARDVRSGEEVRIDAGFTLNASGAWAGRIASMAGIEGVKVVPGKGIMIAMNHRLVDTVINRCTMPADGDILVPIRTVSVIGTTDIKGEDPDQLEVTQAEVDQMLDDGERLVPGFRTTRALRVWAGVRPLFSDEKGSDGAETESRDITRSHTMLDHHERDGVQGFLTITGGKLTTFRLMAQHTVDAMVSQMGVDRPARTADTVLPDSESGETYHLGNRLRKKESHLADEQTVCECELIGRTRLEEAMHQRGTSNLDDLRRTLRLGMGPCQGGFCIYRATGMLHNVEHIDGAEANLALRGFLEERWKGVWPILYGDQLRQARLDDWIFQGLLDVEHLPGGGDLQKVPDAAEHLGNGATVDAAGSVLRDMPPGGEEADFEIHGGEPKGST